MCCRSNFLYRTSRDRIPLMRKKGNLLFLLFQTTCATFSTWLLFIFISLHIMIDSPVRRCQTNKLTRKPYYTYLPIYVDPSSTTPSPKTNLLHTLSWLYIAFSCKWNGAEKFDLNKCLKEFLPVTRSFDWQAGRSVLPGLVNFLLFHLPQKNEKRAI